MSAHTLEAIKLFPLKYIPFLFALCFHEYAHGWMARRKGDNTAFLMGRLTLNPFAHADLWGTLILPAMGMIYNVPAFGWAKPVPVNPRNLKLPLQDMFWIAAAGPLSNLILATVGYFFYGFINAHPPTFFSLKTMEAIVTMLIFFIQINVVLCVFNLIPLHPLDGGKIVARFLPHAWNQKLEETQGMSMYILLFLALTGSLGYIVSPVVSGILKVLSYLVNKVF